MKRSASSPYRVFRLPFGAGHVSPPLMPEDLVQYSTGPRNLHGSPSSARDEVLPGANGRNGDLDSEPSLCDEPHVRARNFCDADRSTDAYFCDEPHVRDRNFCGANGDDEDLDSEPSLCDEPHVRARNFCEADSSTEPFFCDEHNVRARNSCEANRSTDPSLCDEPHVRERNLCDTDCGNGEIESDGSACESFPSRQSHSDTSDSSQLGGSAPFPHRKWGGDKKAHVVSTALPKFRTVARWLIGRTLQHARSGTESSGVKVQQVPRRVQDYSDDDSLGLPEVLPSRDEEPTTTISLGAFQQRVLLPRQVLTRTRTMTFAEKLAAQNGDTACDQCAICLGTFEAGSTIRDFPCAHCFHSSCIDPWLVKSHLCPVCRRDPLHKAASNLSKDHLPEPA